MCVSRNSEDMEEETGIDRDLTALLGRWRRYVSLYLTDQDAATVNWIESFCTDMRKSLIRLDADGRLPASAGGRGPAGGGPAGVGHVWGEPPKMGSMEVKKMDNVSEKFRHYPRFLPLVHIHGAYFVDERLREFRRAENHIRRVVFDSRKGQLMLGKFYIDTCGTCGQEVAILRKPLTRIVKCRVCGAVVPTEDW